MEAEVEAEATPGRKCRKLQLQQQQQQQKKKKQKLHRVHPKSLNSGPSRGVAAEQGLR